MKRKIFVALVLSLSLLALSVGGGVMAASMTSKALAASVTIQTPVPDFEIYADASMTAPIAAVDFGNTWPWETRQRTVYIHNTGQVDYAAVYLSTDLVPEAGALTFNVNNFALETGNGRLVDITYTPGAALGAQSFNINIDAQ